MFLVIHDQLRSLNFGLFSLCYYLGHIGWELRGSCPHLEDFSVSSSEHTFDVAVEITPPLTPFGVTRADL